MKQAVAAREAAERLSIWLEPPSRREAWRVPTFVLEPPLGGGAGELDS